MILAGDIGGTNTRLALVEAKNDSDSMFCLKKLFQAAKRRAWKR